MAVGVGSKLTDVGVIPADWEVRPCHELAERIMVGIVIRPAQYYVSSGVPALRSANIREDAITSLGMVYISPQSNALLAKSQTRAGDVLTVRTGYPGTSAVVPADLAGCNCIDILITRPSKRVNADYLAKWVNSPFGKEQVLRNQGGLAQKHFNVADMRNLLVALPAIPEQHAIAESLNDMDALLASVDRLTSKKRDLKQAVMQQLLTGRTRLPGFESEWRERRLGDHVTFLKNGVNSRAELLQEGRVKYLHYGDVHGCDGVFLSPASLPCLPAPKATSLDRLRDGDLIIADASEDVAGVTKSVEMRDIGSAEVVAGLHTIAARFDSTVLADSFKGFLQFCPPFATHLRRLAAGTKVYATNRAHISSVEMLLPPVREQTAIATLLSDMEPELDALAARRDKICDLKRAMVQELLTGRTRLVAVGTAHA